MLGLIEAVMMGVSGAPWYFMFLAIAAFLFGFGVIYSLIRILDWCFTS